MTDIQKLKAYAERCVELDSVDPIDGVRVISVEPAAVLEMIAEIERLKASNIDQGKQIQWLGEYNTQRHVELSSESVQVIRQRLDAEKERDQLKTENTDLHATLQAAKGEIERLKGENERLHSFETAYKEYSDKTDWVQENAHWSELGMHRADVLRKRCDDAASQLQAQADQLVKLMAENEALRSALQAIANEIEGNTRCLIRDLVNGASGLNNGAHPNDLYEDCDRIDAIIEAALVKEAQS